MNSQFKPLLFIKLIVFSCYVVISSCKQESETKQVEVENSTENVPDKPFFKLSLAQWSLHRAINDQKSMSPMEFAKKADKMGFEGIEYVTQLYNSEIQKLGMQPMMDSLLAESKRYGLRNVLIMVDGEGDLADPSESVRDTSVENHKKWVDAAQFLGCHSIRVNAFGTNEPQAWHAALVDGLTKLSNYAATKNINVLVENHGWLSSDSEKLMAVISEVNMENCGTLPDTGNFCTKRKDGAKWGECEEHFDLYKGMELMMPKAKGVSTKSEDFKDAGETIDYVKIIKIVKDSGFEGFIGIEYEGDNVDEEEGILELKNLVLESAEKISNN